MRNARLFIVLLSAIIAAAPLPILTSDPDPLQDLCVPSSFSSCQHASTLQPHDFVFSGLRLPPNTTSSYSSTGIARTLASVSQFPGLNTLGMSIVRVDFQPGGVNPPHLHPRATEIALVAEGTFYSGFITTDNRLFARVIEKGDVMVFPRGLVHFQRNVGEVHGVLFGSLDSQNPGTVALPGTLFGSGIDDEVLSKAFQLSKEEVQALKAKFKPSP